MTNVYPDCPAHAQYTLLDASRVLKVSKSTLERAVNGYTWSYKGESRYVAPKLKALLKTKSGKVKLLGKEINQYWLDN